MATVKYSGTESLQMQLSELGQKSDKICEAGIYAGANIMADGVRKSVENLRTGGKREYETKRREMQKRGLKNSLGISKVRNDNGFINVKIGFDGYNEEGQANTMVARIFNSGNSFTSKQPFIKNAIRQNRSKSIQAMEKAIDEKIKDVSKI